MDAEYCCYRSVDLKGDVFLEKFRRYLIKEYLTVFQVMKKFYMILESVYIYIYAHEVQPVNPINGF